MKRLKKLNTKHKPSRRRLLVESLEVRRLLAADWRNPVNSIDVNRDQIVTPLDALVVLNEVARRVRAGISDLEPRPVNSSLPFYDVDGNAEIVPLDALRVLNGIRPLTRSEYVLTESSAAAAELSVTIGLGGLEGTRTYQFDVDASFDFDSQSTLQDALAVYLVDPAAPQSTLLDRGEAGTAIFVLSGKRADFVPGMVRFDGQTVSIDLTELGELDTGKLVFQLISQNDQSGTSITIRPHSNDVDINGVLPVRLTSSNHLSALGNSIDFAALAPAEAGHFDVELRNVRFDRATGRYEAELQVINRGESVGRDLAIAFPGLPEGAVLEGAAGQTTDGHPMLSLRPAIAAGGLGMGQRTAPVRVSITTQALSRFHLATVLYVGQPNRAPVFPPLAPVTITPGDRMDVELGASDPDGDRVTYSLRGADNLSMRLSGAGLLSLTPTPSQIGQYVFTVVASDGRLKSEQALQVNVVADPIDTTRISGQVLDIDGTPLQGMQVEVGGVQGLTLADGRFTLDLGSGPVVGDTLKLRGETFPGPLVYPFIAEKLPFILDHEVFPGVNNVIERPIFLPPLDVANGMTIDPMQDTNVTTDAIPGVSVFVGAGTLMNQQGTPFTGVLSITEVPTDLTPAALPPNLVPDLVVTIQPGEMVFATPAPMTFPNRAGWAPGMSMDLWSINPVTGEFDDVGDMQVSADGTTIETISGGVRNSSWHFPSPPSAPPPSGGSGSASGEGVGGKGVGDPRNEDAGTGSCDPNADQPFTSSCNLFSGTVTETHNLVSYESQGIARGVTLIYDSLRADPRPIVHFSAASTPQVSIAQPTSSMWFAANLELLEGVNRQPYLTRTTELPGLRSDIHLWNYTSTERIDTALQLDMSSFDSGVYEYVANTGYVLYASTSFSDPRYVANLRPSYSSFISVNSIESPFGAGWGLAGLQSITVNSRGTALLIDGDGSERVFFRISASEYQSPPGDFSKLEVVDGLFRRTLPDQTVYQFNSERQLATVTDRTGNVTTYNYSNGRLVSIVDPVGAATTFEYAGSVATKIIDPAGRETDLAFDAAGNLISITDPDAARRTWEYDTLHHMTAEVDQLGRREETQYGFHGRAISALRKDGSEIIIQSPQVEGLFPPEMTVSPLSAPTSSPLGAVHANYVDGNGNVTRSLLDRRSQVLSQSDSLGNLSSKQVGPDNLPLVTVDARGFATTYTYDDRGNLLTVKDSLSGASGVEGVGTINVSGSLAEVGIVDRYKFIGGVGQRIFLDSVSGVSMQMEIRDPDDHVIDNVEYRFFDQSSAPIVLTQNGEYSLTVTSQNGFAKDYSFRFIDLNQAPAFPFDTPITGPFDSDQPQIWTFEAVRGQQLTVDADFASAFRDDVLRLFGENKAIFLDTSKFADGPLTITLPETGTYSLVLRHDGSFAANDSLQISLTDPTSIAKTGLDVEHTGTIADGQTQSFAFTATAGTVVMLEKSGENLSYSIVDETAGTSPDAAKPFLLENSGSYRVEVSNFSGAAQDFRFRVVDLTSLTSLVTIGTPVIGSTDVFTSVAFHGTGLAGQQIDFGSSNNARLYYLADTSQSVPAVGLQTLPQDGDFFIVVSRPFTGENEFEIPFVDVNVGTSFAFNAVVSGELDSAVGRRYFTFHANQNDRLVLDDTGSSSNVMIRILGSGHAFPLVAENVQQRERLIVVPEAGTYTLILEASAEDLPAAYRFQLHSSQQRTFALSLNNVLTQSFLAPDETHTYTFGATAGQRVLFDRLSSSLGGASVILLTPEGREVNDGSGVQLGEKVVTLSTTGTYRLVLEHQFFSSPDDRGEYSFRLLDASAAPLIVPDTMLSGGLQNETETDLYRFAGTAGQIIQLALTADFFVSADFYSPSGTVINLYSGASVNPVTVTLSETGDYVLSLSSPDTSGSTKDYSFQLNDVSDTPVTPSGFDTLFSGTLTGQSESVLLATFEGNAGSVIFFDGDADGFIEIRNAANERVGGFLPSESTFVLPTSGEFTLVSSPFASGDYAFRLRLASASTAIQFDEPVSDTITEPGGRKYYRFDVSAGQGIYFDHLDNDFSSEFEYALFRSSGERVLVNGRLQFVPPNAGTYYLEARRRNSTGTIAFQLRELSAIPLTPIDQTVTGVRGSDAESVIIRFQGEAGQEIRLPSEYLLFDAANNFVSSVASSGRFYVLPYSGTYSVIGDVMGIPLEYEVTVVAVEPPQNLGGQVSLRGAQRFTYDPVFSQLTSFMDELGRQTILDIDPANGNVRSVTVVIGDVGGSDDRVTTYSYLASGLVDTITDPLGRMTDFDYDERGNNTQVTLAKGTQDQAVYRFEYDAAGNLTASIDANGNRTQYDYDARGRVTAVTTPDPDGSGPLISPVTRYVYDLRGNLLETIDPLGHRQRTEYDSRDRVIGLVDPGNNRTSLEYDSQGNLIHIRDPLGNVTEYRYDIRNRRTHIIEPGGGVTRLGYDINNNVTSVSDPVGNVTQFAFDARNRIASEKDPLGESTAYTYDPTNNIISIIDRLGRTTEFAYNDLNELVNETWLTSGNSLVNTVSYSYDEVGNLLTVSDDVSSIAFSYDDIDRVTNVTSGGEGGVPDSTLTYTYDAVGNTLSTVDLINGVMGGTNLYSYDALDRVTRITQSGNDIVPKRVDLAYNAMNQFTTLTRFADLAGLQQVATSAYSYDTLNRLASLTHRNAADTVLNSFAFTYDAASRITRITDIDGVTDFTFNTVDELTGAKHSDPTNPDEAYQFDANGNRTVSHIHDDQYTTALANRLSSDGTFNYEYDAEGNLLLRTTIATGAVREFAWDFRNRLVSIADKPSAADIATQVVNFAYDALNRRISMEVDTMPGDGQYGATTYFVYDGDDVLVELIDADGPGPAPATESTRYLHGPGVDQVMAQENSNGTVLWHLADHLGTIHDLVRDDGTIANHLKYDSFGNVISESNAAVESRYRFTGREWDSATDLYFYRARYYNAEVGRFISEDPVKFAGGDANLYRYVGNGPIDGTDAFGKKARSILVQNPFTKLLADLKAAVNAAKVAAEQKRKDAGRAKKESDATPAELEILQAEREQQSSGCEVKQAAILQRRKTFKFKPIFNQSEAPNRLERLYLGLFADGRQTLQNYDAASENLASKIKLADARSRANNFSRPVRR